MKESGVIHKTAEHDLKSKMEHGELLEEDVIKDMARDKLNSEWDSEELSLNAEELTVPKEVLRGQSVNTVVTLSALHHRVLAPVIQPVAVEQEFILKITGTDFELHGRFDVVEQFRVLGRALKRVDDLKTTRLHKKEISGIDAAQLTIYALALYSFDDVIPEIGLHLLRRESPKGRRVAEAYPLKATRNMDHLNRVVRMMESVINNIKRGVDSPAPPGAWWCTDGQCGFWRDICQVRL
jgi:hypothetical protein